MRTACCCWNRAFAKLVPLHSEAEGGGRAKRVDGWQGCLWVWGCGYAVHHPATLQQHYNTTYCLVCALPCFTCPAFIQRHHSLCCVSHVHTWHTHKDTHTHAYLLAALGLCHSCRSCHSCHPCRSWMRHQQQWRPWRRSSGGLALNAVWSMHAALRLRQQLASRCVRQIHCHCCCCCCCDILATRHALLPMVCSCVMCVVLCSVARMA